MSSPKTLRTGHGPATHTLSVWLALTSLSSPSSTPSSGHSRSSGSRRHWSSGLYAAASCEAGACLASRRLTASSPATSERFSGPVLVCIICERLTKTQPSALPATRCESSGVMRVYTICALVFLRSVLALACMAGTATSLASGGVGRPGRANSKLRSSGLS